MESAECSDSLRQGSSLDRFSATAAATDFAADVAASAVAQASWTRAGQP